MWSLLEIESNRLQNIKGGKKLTPFLAELVGTMLLIVFGGGVVGGVLMRKSKAEGAGWVVITIGWGLAVAIAVYAVGQFSGAHINPAVTLGSSDDRRISLGGSSDVYPCSNDWCHRWCSNRVLPLFATLERDEQVPGLKLAVFSTEPAVRHPLSNLTSEIIGTFVLLVGLFINRCEFIYRRFESINRWGINRRNRDVVRWNNRLRHQPSA